MAKEEVRKKGNKDDFGNFEISRHTEKIDTPSYFAYFPWNHTTFVLNNFSPDALFQVCKLRESPCTSDDRRNCFDCIPFERNGHTFKEVSIKISIKPEKRDVFPDANRKHSLVATCRLHNAIAYNNRNYFWRVYRSITGNIRGRMNNTRMSLNTKRKRERERERDKSGATIPNF